jgi:CRP-like cAMP-binding protein
MKHDPSIIQMAAENVRANVLPRPVTLSLDPSIVQKIKQRVPIFSGMSQDCLIRTLAVAVHCAVRADEAVFREGDSGDSFFVLISGEVRVEKLTQHKLVELARLGSGHCFGEMALVGKHQRSATVRASQDCVIMRFERAQIDAMPESAHIIYRNIAGILASRLENSSEQLADMHGRSKEH